MHFFAYGTLMVSDVIAAVCGCTQPGVAASLAGFRRARVTGQSYPAIVADARQQVEGLLYRDLDDTQWQRLDLFEGDQYERQRVRVETLSGPCDAETYVLARGAESLLSADHWSLEAFVAGELEDFMRGYLGFAMLQRSGEQ